MFILSMKMSRKKLIGIMFAIVVVVAGSIFLIGNSIATETDETVGDAVSLSAKDTEEIITFLQHYGWSVETNPNEIVEVAVPTEFNDVYTQYNAIQKKQGFDLEQFKGMRVKRYGFVVKNYPDKPDNMRANVLVSNQKIIGGDICSIELEGYIHGFTLEN